MKFIFPIGILIIAGVLFFAVADPMYGEVKQLKTDVATYEVALKNAEELQDARDSLIETYKNIKIEDKDRLEHFLPSTISNIDLILEIEKIANVHGMPVRDIKFESIRKEKPMPTAEEGGDTIIAEENPEDYLPYGIFPMEFVVEGKYETFVAFLNDLEHNLRLVDIQSISFSVADVSESGSTGELGEVKVDPSVLKYTLKIETYWLK